MCVMIKLSEVTTGTTGNVTQGANEGKQYTIQHAIRTNQDTDKPRFKVLVKGAGFRVYDLKTLGISL